MFKAASGAVYRRAKAVNGGGPTPVITVGPTFIDNGDGTGSWAWTTNISTYAGVDYGSVAATYTYSAFDYSGAGPALELATAHTIPVPDALAGGTAFGAWYYRPWGATPAGFSGYIGVEGTFSVLPVLSSANGGTATSDGSSGPYVTTNCASGTLYMAWCTNGSTPSNAQIIAGTGGGILTQQSAVIAATGVHTFSAVTGQTASTNYTVKFLHVVQSAASSQGSASITTSAGGPPLTNLWGWYVAAGVSSTLGFVTSWADASGNGRTLTPGAAGIIPFSGGIVTFPGIGNSYMGTGAQTLNQPCTVYILGRQDVWVNDSYIADGNNAFGMLIDQGGSTPDIKLYAGTLSAANSNWHVDGTFYKTAFVFNDTSSVMEFSGSAAQTVSAGTGTPGGLTLGAGPGGGNYSKFSVKAVLVYNVAHDQTQRTAVFNYLATI